MKNILLKLFLLLAISLGGCCKCKNIPEFFDVVGFTCEIYQLIKESGKEYSTSHLLADGTQVPFDSFEIVLKPKMEYYGSNSFNLEFEWGSLFSNCAYACKCKDEGSNGSSEQIAAIDIFSDSVFIAGGNVSDTLSHYFTMDGYNSNAEYQPTQDLTSFVKTHPHPLKIFNLALKQKPNAALQHRFTIIYKQTNGESYTIKTSSIVFKP